ncbi:hypothetical protein ACRAQ6_14070 [Erythrobacter sp. HA6-11]
MLSAGERTDTFTLVLATSATVEDLQHWFDRAPAGDRAVYASGFDLPQSAPGVQLVRGWVAQKHAVTTQRRDPADGRKWQFMVQKLSGAGAACPPRAAARVTADRQKLARLLRWLRERAREDKDCPSNRQIAQKLNLGAGDRGRRRARVLLERLELEGKARVFLPDPEGAPRGPRAIEILEGPPSSSAAVGRTKTPSSSAAVGKKGIQ